LITSPSISSPLLTLNKEHPITPPPELVTQWLVEWENKGSTEPPFSGSHEYVSALAARWGADQELEACCADIHTLYGKCRADWLRAARRKPPSLKEQALALLDKNKTRFAVAEEDVIRLALESLPD
jgi:hypothetical protein